MNEYLNSRREWNERYGSYIERERKWKQCAITSLLIALVSVSGLIFNVSKVKLIPYLVEVDKLGKTNGLGLAEKINYKDTRVVRSELVNFITNIRMVSTDVIVQKKAVENVYQHLLSSHSATTFVNNFYKKNNPFESNHKKIIQPKSLLPTSKETWQIEWEETIFNLQGKEIETLCMKASVSISFKLPENENDIIANPIGLYIKDISWTKVI